MVPATANKSHTSQNNEKTNISHQDNELHSGSMRPPGAELESLVCHCW